MIVGVVGNREAAVEIEIADSCGEFRRISAVIDTGFNGHLTLPAAAIARLGLTVVGKRRAWLADGSEVELEMCSATILWHDQRRDVIVSLTEGGPLLGMALLQGSRLTVDVIDHGMVTIEQLTS